MKIWEHLVKMAKKGQTEPLGCNVLGCFNLKMLGCFNPVLGEI